MASLSGNTIQDTYDGLLKLEDSSSGITSTFQNITDGLGNETGVKIKENFFQTSNMFAQELYKYQYYGTGWGTSNFTASIPLYSSPSPTPRKAFIYYPDLGQNSYSGMSYYLNTATIQDEVFRLRFYNAQFIPSIGLLPYQALSEIIELNTTGSTGIYTHTFTNPLSLSPGFNFIVFEGYNAGSPGSATTTRYRTGAFPLSTTLLMDMLGKTNWDDSIGGGLQYFNGFGSRANNTASYPLYDVGFDDTYTSGTLSSGRLAASPLSNTLGFLLHTIF